MWRNVGVLATHPGPGVRTQRSAKQTKPSQGGPGPRSLSRVKEAAVVMAHTYQAFAPTNRGGFAATRIREAVAPRISQPPPASPPELLPNLRGRPLAFLFNYIRRHPSGHLTILLS